MVNSAILMPNWIGDFILALSVVSRKIQDKSERLTLIVPERLAEISKLLVDLPVVIYKRKNRAEVRSSVAAVKELRFDTVYILPHSFSSAWFAFNCRIKHRKGITGELRSFLLTEYVSRRTASRKHHLTDEYSKVLAVSCQEPLFWKGVTIRHSPEYAGAVVLCPGAAYGPSKQWPGFSSLVKMLPDREIVILGDKRDGEIASVIAPRMPHRVHNLAGKTTLQQAAEIIAGASVVVSNDSGLMHLAGYLGRPVVGIFGSTAPVWTRPLGIKVRIARNHVECSPCYKRYCPEKHYNCLHGIKPQFVVNLVKEIIDNALVPANIKSDRP